MKTIPREEIYVLDHRGNIDLQRSPKDYLDLRDQLQQLVNKSEDQFTIQNETHVKPTVQNAYKMLQDMSNDDVDTLLVGIEVNDETLFFTFGLAAQAQSITIN